MDTKVKDLLSEEHLQDIPNFSDTTVRQLLQHTSGIADYYDLRSYLFNDWTQPITLNKMLPVIKRRKPTNAPGETYNYSNSGYLLLGEIAEVTSGESMGDLINLVITTPLALQNTFYNIYQPVGEDIHGYGTYLRPWKDTHEYWEHSGPDGGITASVSDVSAFLQALLIKESKLTNTGTKMLSDLINRTSNERQGLGIETIQSRSGEEIFGHTGDVFGYQTIAYAFPNRNIVIVAQINCNCTALTASLIGNLFRTIVTLDKTDD